MSENWISFPNLNLTFNLNPVAFTVGAHEVRWSMIFSVIAVAVGILLYIKAVSKQKQYLGNKQVAAVTAVTAFFALFGARLFFVVPQNLWLMDQFYQMNGNYPDEGYYNTFYKFIAFFEKDYTGLNLFGGLIFGFIALAVICKLKKWPLTKYLDSLVYALPASFAINALGYITDQSSFGQHSDSLLAINGSRIQDLVYDLYQSSVVRGGAAVGPNVKWVVGKPVSPTPIYEILGCITIMLIVYLLSKFVLFTGEKFLWSFGLYGFLRALTESSRIDALLFWNMRVNVLFSIAAVAICVLLVVIIRWQVREGRLRNVSQYVDPRKNDGFENDTFYQKIYKGENTEPPINSGENNHNGAEAGKAEPKLKIADNKSKLSDLSESMQAEFEQSEGTGQVWTFDETAQGNSAEDNSAEDNSAEDNSAEDNSAEDNSAEDNSAEDSSAEDSSAEDNR